MIHYQFLDAVGMAEVARERVAELEREHYRLRLLLGENTGNAEAQAALLGQIGEIERRHAVHTAEPEPEPVADPAAEPEQGDDRDPAQGDTDVELATAGSHNGSAPD